MARFVIAYNAGDGEEVSRRLSLDVAAVGHENVVVELGSARGHATFEALEPGSLVVAVIGPRWSPSESEVLTSAVGSRSVRMVLAFYAPWSEVPFKELILQLGGYGSAPRFWFTQERWATELQRLLGVVEGRPAAGARPTRFVPPTLRLRIEDPDKNLPVGSLAPLPSPITKDLPARASPSDSLALLTPNFLSQRHITNSTDATASRGPTREGLSVARTGRSALHRLCSVLCSRWRLCAGSGDCTLGGGRDESRKARKNL